MSDPFETLRDALAGRYAVERELGRGGMATVFLAEDLKHHRPVAIKVLHPELAAALGADRFLREIQIAARLQHPHILPLYDSGAAAGLLYYVMPFVEGESLRDRLDREKQLGLEEAVRIATEVSGALAYAHSHGVVHRDIKPENILLSGGTAVVADFGIARAVTAAGDADQITKTGTVIGTPAYMSPEQATGSLEIDGRSDEYSLACVVYEMLVGQPPFTGPTAQAVLARHSLDAVSPPHIVRASIPDTVEGAILRGLEKVPADRFPTAALFAEALSAPGAAVGARRSTRATARHRPGLPRALAFGGAALVLALGVWLAVGRRHSGAAAESTAGLDPRHVAVLYFEDLSPKHDLGYLADGLTEALIGELDRVPTLDVISANGVAQFRTAGLPRDSVARALKVGSLIAGSVEDAGERVRVTVRLVEGASGADIERAGFERAKGDLLRVRDELTQQVAGVLRRRLGEEVRLKQQRAGTTNVSAWVLVQQGEKAAKDAQALVQEDDAPGAARAFRQADSLLAAAERLDPSWAQPIVSRASVAYRQSRLTTDARRDAPFIERGLGHIDRALAMDANNADALELRGSLRYWRYLLRLSPDPDEAQRLLRGAEADLRDAVRINPEQAGAWSALSHMAYQRPDYVEAKIDAQRAYEADAYLGAADLNLWRLYTTSYDLEQFADAVHWCDVGGQRFPTNPRFVQCRLWVMTSNAVDPDPPRAWRLVDEIVKLTPQAQRAYASLEAQLGVAAVLARAGLPDSARRVAARSRGDAATDPERELLSTAAFVYTLLGDRDQALRLLQEQMAANPEHRVGLARSSHWWWRSLRDDPRYKELVGSTR